MKVYIYDNSFEGLLSAVYDAYYCTEKPELILSNSEYEMNFLYDVVYIETDNAKYRKVSNAIRSKISDLALEYIYHAYLSEISGVSMQIFEYIRLGFKTGSAITTQHTNDIVKKVHDASLKTTRENHLLIGLIRFKRIKGDIYYASINPDHNVLTMLAPHFQDRLSDQRWIIHDLKRGIAAIYDKHNWVLQTLYSTGLSEASINTEFNDDGYGKNSMTCTDDNNNSHFSKVSIPFNADSVKEADIDYENLWRLYHKHISIETKRNIKLQKQHMPSRYWNYLPEKKLY